MMECGARILEFSHEPLKTGISCSRCSLGDLCLPRNLSAEETARLEGIVERSNPMRAGDHLFRAGESFRAILAVRSGCFKSYIINEAGEEQVLDFHLPGELVGLDAIHSGTHLSTCVALDTGGVCKLNFGPLSELSRQIPALQAELFEVMSQRIADLEITCSDHTADQRIAMFLESLSRRYSRRGYSAREFNLAMSRRDIASYLRLATETVSRILSRFRKLEILEVHRKQIRILDPAALRDIASGQAA
ncbi:MAG: fumarate/nitrate reduction transcriptional regulator Fnr [Xanthomonadales bacterium]|nr:fumarate/nitrate reduction transcriptional regulator Fnr [Xanthomonadales bacterium]